jgi:hypothetical protein
LKSRCRPKDPELALKALQGLEGEQNVGVATTNGAIRLLHASYSLITHLLENTELILRTACEDTRD